MIQEIINIFNFYLHPGTAKVHKEMVNGTFEPTETAMIKKLLESCSVFVDIGANIGYYSKIASDMGKYVIAIEPQQANVKKLYSHVNNNNIEVYPIGLGESPKILNLYGTSSVSASVIPDWANELKAIKQTIPISTLDIILGERFKTSQMLIKVDVEGYEHQVLLGALKTLNRQIKAIWIIEICDKEFHPEGKNPYFKDTFDLMKRSGYTMEQIDYINYIFRPIEHYNDNCR